MPISQHASRSRRGFTLIEALLAMIIVALAALGLLTVIPTGFQNVQMNAVEVQAVSVAQQYLEQERNRKLHGLPAPTATTVAIDAGQSFTGGSIGGYGSFTVTPDGCTPAQSIVTTMGETVYSCSVTVSWTENDAARSVTVQSYVTK